LILGPAGIEFIQGKSPEEAVAIMYQMVESAGFTIAQLFSSMTNSMMSMLAVVPLLIFVLKVKGEETDIRAELVFATPTSRIKYFAGFAAIAFVSSIIFQFMLAYGMHMVAAPLVSTAPANSISGS
jgi:ABC-2 type transport system permease protein